MVSLRHNLSLLRWAVSAGGNVLVLVGVGLMALCLAGIALHGSATRSFERESLSEYAASLRAGAPFDLDEATHRIYLGTTHSDGRRVAITENWLQWTLGRIYAPLARTQDGDRLMTGNIANCSERSQILKDLTEGAGYPCRFVGLTGHVVLEVETGYGWRVADPDYGVVYPVGIAALQQADGVPLIHQTLTAAGYPPPTIDRYLAIVQSADNNVVLPVGSALSPRLDFIEHCCQWLVWMIPVGCVVVGVGVRLGRWRRATPASQLTVAAPSTTLSRAAF